MSDQHTAFSNLAIIERLVRLETKDVERERLVTELRDDVKHIRSVLDQGKGGVKMALIALSLASAIGGAIGWLISHFKLFGGSQ